MCWSALGAIRGERSPEMTSYKDSCYDCGHFEHDAKCGVRPIAEADRCDCVSKPHASQMKWAQIEHRLRIASERN